MSCLIVTKEIRELATKFPGETEESVRNLVSLWQEQNKKSTEEYPLASELNSFIQELRQPEKTKNIETEYSESSFNTPTISTLEEQAKVDLDFDPQTRRDRVSLISRLFSNEVSNALEELQNAITNRMNESQNEYDKEQLAKELNELSRFSAIRTYTPAGLFNRVLNTFKSYVNDSEENRIQAELNAINAAKGSEKYTDEQKLAAAKKKAEYKTQAYNKIINNFKALAEEASTMLIASEGIIIDPSYMSPKETDNAEDTPEGDVENEGADKDWKQEETYKDGWMTNYIEVSSHESLSQAVRKIISQVPKLDYRGKYEKDDLGFTRYLDADYVHATLIDKLRFMITSDDMVPLLDELSKNKIWVKQITKLIQSDETLYSKFYQDFRKDFVNYWIQKRKIMPDGTTKWETIAINKPEGIYYLLDAWRDNYESGNKLDDDSVYNKDGSISKENAEKGLKLVEELNNKFNNLSTEDRLKLLEDAEVWKNINKALSMLSIDANPAVLKNALTNIKNVPGIKFTDPIMLLLPELNIIFKGIKDGDIKSEKLEDGTEKRGDLINTFGSAYNSIASMIAEVTDDAIESSVRENDKSYYSHVTPSYLGKLMKQLKNVMNDPKRFEEFMNTEFKQYEWFFKDGHWMNDWVAQLAESAEMRKGLNHKVVLNSNKVAYQDWDDLDYTIALLTEYWGDPEKSNSDVQWAWYHVPILSDAPSAEFIRFRKYVSGKVLDEDGNYRTYDDIILDKLVDAVNQEYDRIMLVRNRDSEYQKGNQNISPIANYDIVRNADGSIKNIGGAEFKFFPSLNNINYNNGETFLDRIARLQKEGSGDELRKEIRNALKEVIDNSFDETYREWNRIGLFNELENGKYKYLPFEGQSKQNAKVAKTLNKVKNILGNSLWTTNMELLLRDFNNNNVINDRIAETLFNQISSILDTKVQSNEISLKDAQDLKRGLTTKNNTKSALREYFWNSTFATSQIIELTTTDLAFYKNLEDFQKRYKEVHAPSLRMNTKATYKGERIGRDWERTVYLQDDVIVSSALQDITEVLDAKVQKGEISKLDRDFIISKFKEVNVADAQAYRSLSSYRAILGMSGQWNEAMQQAYDNFKNGTWNIADFNIIWQTKKPFVYTQVNNTSGIEGHTGIKTPVQHKNSEFLLLAMHQLISNSLGKSNKLRAINKFMEENNIDVVQFESTTKVGKQSTIDLSGDMSESQVMDLLKNVTGIASGNENPNVVHKISYEDYGIQTATPEHVIDTVQLVGTQIRKLITADIAEDAVIEVDGKKLTKKEWLDLYNRIITENIIQKFSEVNEIFKDPKNIEKILQEELRSSSRYGQDMKRACTLDESGNFNIPLFDPVQSQRIQTLLNSIIKSRITKQKIRGGALIQVSDYGLTDELHIVFEGEGANKRIKYLECYMPAYSREFYEPLMDAKTHQLDINKLPKDLRKLVGYRV